MRKLKNVLREISCSFQAGGCLNAKREAEDLLCDFLDCSRGCFYSNEEKFLTDLQYQVVCDWVARRLRGEPLAYLSGKVEFYKCSIQVSPAVLIPRPETEILVDKIVAHLQKEDLKGKELWDICSGSGCIGIALKKALPDLTVFLSDSSEEAVDLAVYNAKVNDVHVECLKGDLLAPFKEKKAHFVVSNPPYISEIEFSGLSNEVRGFEPRLALVADSDGLEFYEKFASQLPLYLHAGGRAWFEIGYQQGEAVRRLFLGSPWKSVRVENDWAGHHRFFFLEIE